MKKLFDTVSIGQLTLRNRFVRSATWENMADEHDHPSEQLVSLYRNLAAGGVGTIISSILYVEKNGKALPRMMGIDVDTVIPALVRLTDAVHAEGAKIIAQLAYGGIQSIIGITSATFSPSGVAEPVLGTVGKAMTEQEITELVHTFTEAARRAARAGFDGVQVHAAHGYLLGQFLSPYHNTRNDRYGGSIENRCRIITEIVASIKEHVPGIAVLVKINGRDHVEGGLALADSLRACILLEAAGCDAIEVSGGVATSKNAGPIRTGIARPEDEGYFSEDAALIADKVQIPVLSVGGYRSYEVMEAILNNTEISLFSMSRPFLAEPDLIKRWQAGDRKKAFCLSCNRCRTDQGNICTMVQHA